MRTSLVVFAVATLACSGGRDDSSPGSLSDLCAGSPRNIGDGLSSTESCPFVQQVDNVNDFGVKLSAPRPLHDGSGAVIATVTHTCDRWAMGTDPHGVQVLVSRDNGVVVSHGSVHPGQIKSTLATPAELPLK